MLLSRKTRDARAREELFEEIVRLEALNRNERELERERRIVELRHLAGIALVERPERDPQHPIPSFERLPGDGTVPEVSAAELTPELARAGILRNGCLLVRGLVDAADCARLAGGIERALAARSAHAAGEPLGDGYFEPFHPQEGFQLAERGWVSDSGGLWAADSPPMLVDVLDTLERAGLRDLISGYLGERPALSINKSVLRKVSPDSGAAWHQDGAFLGEVRALNVWLSLSRCGDLAPGMDIVPRRFEEIVPTGTEGAIFNWSVAPEMAVEAAGETPIVRPIFEPGDVLLFDEMFLHQTAADPGMPNHRYAVETWCFGPSAFPGDYVPLAF